MKTCYIVKHVSQRDTVTWTAHRRGTLSLFNRFTIMNEVIGSSSYSGPDECERFLRRLINPIKPIVVRVVRA